MENQPVLNKHFRLLLYRKQPHFYVWLCLLWSSKWLHNNVVSRLLVGNLCGIIYTCSSYIRLLIWTLFFLLSFFFVWSKQCTDEAFTVGQSSSNMRIFSLSCYNLFLSSLAERIITLRYSIHVLISAYQKSGAWLQFQISVAKLAYLFT